MNLISKSPRRARRLVPALVACMKQHGVTPPAHVPAGTSTNHTGTPPAGGAGGGGSGSSARQAAFKACGVTGHFGGASHTTTTGG
jgi:hypothetical protein